jgi:hypothetical protein
MPKRLSDQDPETAIAAAAAAERAVGGAITEGAPQLVNAKVVYLGSRRNRQLPLKGQIGQEKFDDGAVTEHIKDVGFTSYDWSTHDLRGRLMTHKMMPATHPEQHVRNKPFCIVKHPSHLWELHRMRDAEGNPEFSVIASGRDAILLDEYFLRRSRALRVADEDFSHIRSNATASDAVGAE